MSEARPVDPGLSEGEVEQLVAWFKRHGRYPFHCPICNGHEWYTTKVALLLVETKGASHQVLMSCQRCHYGVMFDTLALTEGSEHQADAPPPPA